MAGLAEVKDDGVVALADEAAGTTLVTETVPVVAQGKGAHGAGGGTGGQGQGAGGKKKKKGKK
jgi:hypothetical protein